MALKGARAILGIELDDHEIRIVEVRTKNGESSISALTAFTPPAGYLTSDGILNPAEIGHELKEALANAGIKTADAAFGLPSWCCAQRPLGVPPVEGNELYFIAEGEIDHIQLFREPGYSFDLVRLNDAKLLESSGRNFLLVGAEFLVLESVRLLARAAGLHIAAVEPTHSALYRIAYSQAATPPNIFVTLSETHAEISLLDLGEVALHRTFDLGTSIFDTPETEEGGFKPYFDIDAASSLAVELRRSIDFIARELPESPPTEILHLACTHSEAKVLAHWLESALSVEVQVADIRRGGPQIRINKALEEEDTNRYVAAYGLALRERALLPPLVPVVNMFAYEEIRIGVREDGRKKLRVAMFGSCALLVCGLLTAVLGTVRAHQAAAALVASQAKLVATQQLEQQKSNEVALRTKQLAMLEAAGVPARNLIQAIVRSIPKDVGLVEVKMDPLTEELSGETLSEASIIHMSDSLRNDPAFTSVSLEWFERVNPAVPAAGLRFRMNMSSPPQAAPAPSPVASNVPVPNRSGPNGTVGDALTKTAMPSATLSSITPPAGGGKS